MPPRPDPEGRTRRPAGPLRTLTLLVTLATVATAACAASPRATMQAEQPSWKAPLTATDMTAADVVTPLPTPAFSPAGLPPLARQPVSPKAAAIASTVPVPSAATISSGAAVPDCAVSAARLPDPARPVVDLALSVARDHRHLAGTENVVFTPDRPVTELVFRLWPNGPEGGRRLASLTVSQATSPGAGPYAVAALGARPGTQGTLLSIPLHRTAPAGTPITASLAFSVALPPATWDRLGTDGTTAYWGSSHPLLAWQRGVGWTRDPASPIPGETATSEAADTTITVTAPAVDTVLAPGTGATPVTAGTGLRRWRFHAEAVRDVAVVAGPFATVTSRLPVAGRQVDVVAAVAPGVHMSSALLMAEAQRALPALADRFGPVPFDVLRVVAVPGLVASGIEYPGMALLLPQSGPYGTRVVETHELAHQWFYGMVGNDQARDPWLDEAFATYAEAQVDGTGEAYRPTTGVSPVGRSMASFGGDYNRYESTVYSAGASALRQARDAAGPAAFDAAVLCYVRTQAWQVSTPSAFAAQLRALPAATAVLHRAGAF